MVMSPARHAPRGERMPNHSGHAAHSGHRARRTRREPSSRVGMAWSRQTPTGYKNFLCPVCGSHVRHLKIRGNLSPVIECSNDACRWTVDELTRENNILELAQKPRGISTRQWHQAKATEPAGGRC